MTENRLEVIKDFLSEVQSAVGKDAVVSISYDGNELVGLISFHNNDSLSEDVDPVRVEFEDEDFEESGHEEFIRDIQNFVPSHIDDQLGA